MFVCNFAYLAIVPWFPHVGFGMWMTVFSLLGPQLRRNSNATLNPPVPDKDWEEVILSSLKAEQSLSYTN